MEIGDGPGQDDLLRVFGAVGKGSLDRQVIVVIRPRLEVDLLRAGAQDRKEGEQVLSHGGQNLMLQETEGMMVKR